MNNPHDPRLNKSVTDYWHDHYMKLGMCSLCANTGVLDTRSAVSASGERPGKFNYCICPNGQLKRAHKR